MEWYIQANINVLALYCVKLKKILLYIMILAQACAERKNRIYL